MPKEIKKLHAIESFGIRKVSFSSIRVERIEDRVEPKVPFPHKHDFYQIMLVTSGTGWHQIDFIKHKIVKNQIFIMKPGQIHTWVLEKGIKGYLVEFNRASLEGQSFMALNESSDRLVLKKSQDFEKLLTVCEIMFQEFQLEQELFDACLKSYLTGFLIQLLRFEGQSLPMRPHKDSIVENFRHLLEHHFKQEHLVEFYAKEMKLTPKALTMQLSRLLGKSPRFLIQERFLLEAKRYLAYSQLSISDIGYEIGFEDPNYFTRFFRQHEKITPAQFRKKTRR